MLEATDAADRVGPRACRRTPRTARRAHAMGDSDPLATFTYLGREFGKRGIAFICAREFTSAKTVSARRSRPPSVAPTSPTNSSESLRRSGDSGREADAVAWGKLFIANPDLPRRMRLGEEFNTPDPATFYGEKANAMPRATPTIRHWQCPIEAPLPTKPKNAAWRIEPRLVSPAPKVLGCSEQLNLCRRPRTRGVESCSGTRLPTSDICPHPRKTKEDRRRQYDAARSITVPACLR